MKILHTSDWHLGKNLRNFSRLDEQKDFIDEFIFIANTEKSDIVIIAGDIFDVKNPPAKAEELYFYALKELSNNKDRLIIVVSGNHDNPKRIFAPSPFFYENGIIVASLPNEVLSTGDYGFYNIIDAKEGYIEVLFKGEVIKLLFMPFPSEKTLNLVFDDEINNDSKGDTYISYMNEVLCQYDHLFTEDSINIMVSHLFVEGGIVSDERNLDLGGSKLLPTYCLPDKMDYIALGHLHKPQQIKYKYVPVYYAGSPIQYSESEMGQAKTVYSVDIIKGKKTKVNEIFLKNIVPIVKINFNSIDEALEFARENEGTKGYFVLQIITDRQILKSEIAELKALLNIVDFNVMIAQEQAYEDFSISDDMDMYNEFFKFYHKTKGLEPTGELMELFESLLLEEDNDEAVNAQI